MTRVTIGVRVTGRVQGVYYRGWTKTEAERRGLTGWVRNEADGSVSALLAGPDDAVAAMIEALWQGPASARVSNVETRPSEPAEWPREFAILR